MILIMFKLTSQKFKTKKYTTMIVLFDCLEYVDRLFPESSM